jgi:hypothetical protein
MLILAAIPTILRLIFQLFSTLLAMTIRNAVDLSGTFFAKSFRPFPGPKDLIAPRTPPGEKQIQNALFHHRRYFAPSRRK